MTNPTNPFAVSMTRLWIPPHMSQMINVGGFEVEADKDGAIDVPHQYVADLTGHGLSATPPDAAKKAKV